MRRRDPAKLPDDPALLFNVGQLVGAAEMAGHWMTLQEDKTAQEVGRRLLSCTGWFYGDERPELMAKKRSD